MRAVGGRLNLGDVFVTADGTGGNVATALAGDGGSGVGGEARLEASSGGTTIVSGQPVAVQAGGTGGAGGQGTGGQGTGGLAIVPSFGGTLTFGGDLFAFANGNGGGGTVGGGGVGGEVNIVARAGTLSLAQSSTIVALARGGGGDGANGGAGGTGEGGLFRIGAINGTAPGLLTIGTSLMDASAVGGTGGAGVAGGAGGRRRRCHRRCGAIAGRGRQWLGRRRRHKSGRQCHRRSGWCRW